MKTIEYGITKDCGEFWPRNKDKEAETLVLNTVDVDISRELFLDEAKVRELSDGMARELNFTCQDSYVVFVCKATGYSSKSPIPCSTQDVMREEISNQFFLDFTHMLDKVK